MTQKKKAKQTDDLLVKAVSVDDFLVLESFPNDSVNNLNIFRLWERRSNAFFFLNLNIKKCKAFAYLSCHFISFEQWLIHYVSLRSEFRVTITISA
jgi:hypothetical protein